jgi:hypothetical protein
VQAFFATRGESMLNEVAAQREAASEAMDFEQAAALHKQWERVKAAATLADELVRPVANLRAVVLQEAAPRPDHEHPDRTLKLEEAAVFLLENGRLAGPERLSTLGVRAVREQTAVGSSLFAQPLMLAPIPLDEPAPNFVIPDEHSEPNDLLAAHATTIAESVSTSATLTPEDRARAVLATLASQTETTPEIAEICDYLALFRRWYYRPEKQRQGEVFLPNPDHSWPIRRILNGAARVVLGPPAAAPPVLRDQPREALKDLKTKVIHEGREGVERVVPVLPKRSRTRKSITPADVTK